MIYTRFRAIANRHGERRALIDGQRSLTFAELDSWVDAFGRRLDNEGVQPGDVVAGLLPNSIEFVAWFFATASRGAVAMPLNTGLRERETAQLLSFASVSHLVTTRTLHEKTGGSDDASSPTPNTILVETIDETDTGPIRSATGGHQGTALYIATSGSTGTPKIVPRSHAAVLAGLDNVTSELDISHEQRFIGVVPFYHAHGFANTLMASILNGARLVVMERFLPRRLLDLIEEHEVDTLIGSPFIFNALIKYLEQGSLACVRTSISGGAAMPPGLADDFQAKAGLLVRELYGSSEAGTIGIQAPEIPPRPGLQVCPIVSIRIVDDSGAEVASGESGQITVSTPAMSLEYLNGSDNERPRDGYWWTGDIGHLEGDRRSGSRGPDAATPEYRRSQGRSGGDRERDPGHARGARRHGQGRRRR